MRKIFIIIFCLAFFGIGFPQLNLIEGEITYLSSQNVYVKFESTEGIKENDTLFAKEKEQFIPAVLVQFLSSRSAAGENLGKRNLKTGDKLFAYVEIEEETNTVDQQKIIAEKDSIFDNQEIEIKPKKYSGKISPNLFGKFSVQSYSNFSNQFFFNDYQRWRYTFSITANRIAGEDLSFSNYTSFAYRADDWSRISDNFGEALRVYDLSVKYNFAEKNSIIFGRNINRNITNIGPIDGLQYERKVGNFSIGGAVGSRPDFKNLGYNIKLFQFGIYAVRADTFNERSMENSVAVFEQTNDFKTDRRFVYIQHRNNLIEKTNLFASSEVDIYSRENGIVKNKPILTGIFLSARYAPSGIFSFSLSYDARKNVIYYETFKSFADSLLDKETRQGFRLSSSIRPFNRLLIGANYGYRFQKGDIKPSKNFGGFINYALIPFLDISAGINFNKLSTNYLEGTIWGGRISKYSILNFVDLSLSYRKVNYDFTSDISNLNQDIISSDLYISFLDNYSFIISYEGIFENKRSDSRLLSGITYRF